MSEQDTSKYRPSKLEIVEAIDPDWREHFIDADQAYDFYAINPQLIAATIEGMQG